MTATTAIQEADRRLLRFLRASNGATVSELLAEMGLSRSAIRQRLVRLQAAGLLYREAVRRGRGRPYYVYRLSREAEQQFGWLLPELAAALWFELKREPDSELRQRLLAALPARLAEPIRAKIGLAAGVSRVRALVSLLASQGLEAELDLAGELPVIRQHDCPFGALPHDDPELCALSRAIVHAVLGFEVGIGCCRARDPEANWCEYRIQLAGTSIVQPQHQSPQPEPRNSNGNAGTTDRHVAASAAPPASQDLHVDSAGAGGLFQQVSLRHRNDPHQRHR